MSINENSLGESPASRLPAFTRGRLFASLALTLVIGGFAPLLRYQFETLGPMALPEGGGVSWAVWLGLAAAVRLALIAPSEAPGRGDLAVGAACLLLVAAPQHYLVNIAATGLALWFAAAPRNSPQLRSAGVVLGALVVSTFWAKHLLVTFASPIEHLDAWMVGRLAGTPVQGNVVQMLDGTHTYLLGSPCTSVRNASLAILLFIAITRSLRPEGGWSYWLMIAAVFASAVMVNIGRLALMTQNMQLFNFLHVGFGAGLVSLVVTATGLGWAAFAVRREIFR